LKGGDDRGPAVSPEEAEYFRLIEERFCALRGAAMLLSPRDWNLIAGWWAERRWRKSSRPSGGVPESLAG
jgi:hypothetical protein